MWDWLSRLFRKDEDGKGAETTDSEQGAGERQRVDLSEPRKLSPMDSPTILARLKTLGVLDFMDPNQEQALKRIVLTHCREGRTEMWWWSLLEFVRTRKTHSGDMPFQVVEERCETGRSLKERLITVEELFRAEGLQFRKISGPDGEAVHDRAQLEDGTYAVKYRVGEQEGQIDVSIADGAIDIPPLVAELNGIAQAKRWSYRLVLLPPEKTSHCVVRCDVGTAERAKRSQWGSVDYPPKVIG